MGKKAAPNNDSMSVSWAGSLQIPYNIGWSELRNGIYVKDREKGEDFLFHMEKTTLPPRFHPNWTASRFMELAIIVAWCCVLWPGWIGKYFGERQRPYEEFLTNWSFTMQALAWTLKLISYCDGSGRLLYWWYIIVWWPMATTAWAVFVLVVFVLEDNPGLLLDMFRDYGAGTVLFANTIYHILTYTVILFSMVLVRKDLQQMLWLSRKGLFLQCVFQVALAHIPILIYSTFNDFNDIYGLKKLHWWHILLLYEVGCIMFWTVGFILAIGTAEDNDGGSYDRSYFVNMIRKMKPHSSPSGTSEREQERHTTNAIPRLHKGAWYPSAESLPKNATPRRKGANLHPFLHT